jgi:hypothetical protein
MLTDLRLNVFRGIKREQVTKALAVLLIAVIVICVVIIIFALLSNAPSRSTKPTPDWPTTHFSTTPTRATPIYKNCREAHADGRWDIPKGDPAYRPGLDGDGNGIACESPKSRRAAR